MSQPIFEALFALRDEKYRAFAARLIPSVEASRVLGVRTPALRALAKQLAGTPAADAFLRELPHQYLEENTLHAALLSFVPGGIAQTLRAVDVFLPYVDNWATCDSIKPPIFKKYPEEVYRQTLCWLRSPCVYAIRFALDTLQFEFLGPRFDPSIVRELAAVKPGEYYVDMALAWYLATALSKQWDAALPWLKAGVFSPFVQKMAVRKALESYRVPDAHKAVLRALQAPAPNS